MNNNTNNPIINNRIINDYTFSTRLLNFLSKFYPDCASWNQIEEEEYIYLCIIAKSLLEYQKETTNENYEIDYFKNTENTLNKEFKKFLNKLTTKNYE